jgi:outer membrane protein assembly factor BamB
MRLIIILATVAITLSSGIALAEDWPQWGYGPGRNMASDAKNMPLSFGPGKPKSDSRQIDMSTTRNVKWAIVLGSQTYGNPVISNGRIIVGTNDAMLKDPRFKRTRGGLVLCCDAETGKTLWKLVVPRYEIRERGFYMDQMNLGICNSASIEGDRAYIVTGRGEVLCLDMNGQADGNDGAFQNEGNFMAARGFPAAKLNKSDADIIWRYDMVTALPVRPHDAVSCAALIHGDFIYAGTSNGPDLSHINLPYPDAASFIVLNKKTGKLVAKDDEKIGRRVLHGQWSSPSMGQVGGKTLIFYGAGDGLLYAFEPLSKTPDSDKPATLKKVWSYDCNPKDYRFDPSGKKRLYQRLTGPARNKVRREGPSEIIATPVFHKGRVYVATGHDPNHGTGKGMLSCVDAATGKKVWDSRQVERSLSTCSIYDGLLYIADYSGNIHCFDVDTGKRHWVHHTDPKYNEHPYWPGSSLWSSTFAVDGKVYLGTERKELWVFKAAKKKKILNRITLLEKMSNTPITAGGVLYITTGRYLYAVTAKGQ